MVGNELPHPGAARQSGDGESQEFDRILDDNDPGTECPSLTFDPAERRVTRHAYRSAAQPRVAILREQGVNSQYEMAAAFMRAGFPRSMCT